MADDFTRQLSQIRPPQTADFPPVRYPTQCHGLCTWKLPQAPLDMQNALFSALASRTSTFSVADDIFVACEARGEGEQALVCFALLASALSQHGRFIARQQFVQYEIVTRGAGPGYVGTILRMSSSPNPIDFAPEMPGVMKYFSHVASGIAAPIVMSEGTLVAKMMNHTVPDWPQSVAIRFLRTEPLARDAGDIDFVKIVDCHEVPI